MQEEPPNMLDASTLVGPGHSPLAEVARRLAALRCATVGKGGGEVGRGGFRLTDGRGESVYLTPAGGAQADVLLVVARQMLSEQAELARHKRLAKGLGNKLMQAYEETRAVFSVIRLGTTGGNVAQNMQAICEQAHAALPFGWLGIAFNNTGATIEALRGSVMLAGKTASGADLSGQVRALIEGCQGLTRTVIFERGSHPLATTTDSQIVWEPITHSGLVVGCLVAGERYMIDNEPEVASPELLLLGALGDFLGTFHENAARFAEQRSMSLGTLAALSAAIDAKDPYTHGHSERVAMVAQLIAQKMGMSEAEAERVRIAGLVHDVGKIGVPENILCKAGRLSDDEMKQIKQHPEIGYRILAEIPALQDVLPGVLHHHEQFNGKGYPHALAGEAIPLIARIIGLADTFDAMSSSRAYRQALPMEKVLAEIKQCAGTQLDPAVVEAFMTIDLSGYHAVLPGQEQSVETASKNGPATTDRRTAA